jgi:hypothetical protein
MEGKRNSEQDLIPEIYQSFEVIFKDAENSKVLITEFVNNFKAKLQDPTYSDIQVWTKSFVSALWMIGTQVRNVAESTQYKISLSFPP